MANKVSTKPPSGMRDFLPSDLVRRQHVVGIVRSIYERYGFMPLETPSIENLDILTGKYGEDEKLIYRILHRGDTLKKVLGSDAEVTSAALADQALRYDLTVPLARVVAQYRELPKYFKRYQIQPVWRADRPGKGRFREFYQCDVDITGTTSVVAEAEVLAAGCEVLTTLGFADFEFSLNHRGLLRSLIKTAGIDIAQEGTALQAVDKLDKIGVEGVLAELEGRGVGRDEGATLLELVGATTDGTTVETLRARVSDEAGQAALAELEQLMAVLESTPAAGKTRFAPQLARGLGYYTGPIYEARVPDLAGSIAGGGRYDELVGMFGKHAVPAVGLALGLERILVVMAERGLFPDLQQGPEVMVCWRGVEMASVLRVAHALRARGLRVEVFPEPTKLGKQVQYADAPGVKAQWVAVVAERELADGTVTLKHLESGDQAVVPLAEVSGTVRRER